MTIEANKAATPHRGRIATMPSWWKISVVGACVVIASGVCIAWWTHWKVAKSRSLEASVSRVRAEHGDIRAQYKLASMYYLGRGVPQDYGEAARWYRKAAEQGDAAGQFNLGFMYHDGKGVPQDYQEAANWSRKAAEQGDPKGQSALGYAYYSGEGVQQDYSKSARRYRKAAEQGYALAQQALGYAYYSGKGVQQDDTQAVAWYRKAAEQGDAVAQQGLGYMYAEGRGVPKDYGEAVRWYQKAAEQGDARARISLEALGSRSRPPTNIRYLELSIALVTLTGGLCFLWSSMDFLRRGGRFLDWQQLAGTLLSLDLLAYSGMSFYAFAQDIRFCSFYDAFHLAKLGPY
jgi:TPR repeat protein